MMHSIKLFEYYRYYFGCHLILMIGIFMVLVGGMYIHFDVCILLMLCLKGYLEGRKIYSLVYLCFAILFLTK